MGWAFVPGAEPGAAGAPGSASTRGRGLARSRGAGRPGARADALASALLFAAVAAALGGLTLVLSGWAWWFVAVGAALVVIAVPAIVRAFTARWWWPPLAALASAILVLTVFFAVDTAWLGLVPTQGTFDRFGDLARAGEHTILTQGIPADADVGLVYLVCLGVVGLCLALDVLVFAVRSPALAGAPLLVLLVVPAAVRSDIESALPFALAAAAYLLLLVVTTGRPVSRPVAGFTAVAIAGALVLSAVLPPVDGLGQSSGATGPASGVNPIVTLGDDLRATDDSLALSYVTNAGEGLYLRLATLADFSGSDWAPRHVTDATGNDVATIGPAPGLTELVPRTVVDTTVTVADLASSWLPVPYAATTITGLQGDWGWDPRGLSVHSYTASMGGQEYQVTSQSIEPTAAQLRAAGLVTDPELEEYLALPDDLPTVVADTAVDVAGEQPTPFDQAMALQEFFQGGQFTYSQDAPTAHDYDGSGAQVLEPFLAHRSGYCVHFSSAMAAMARVLGIPSRVVVGFAPGSQQKGAAGTLSQFDVTTHDLHAWPELYFDGIGWVQFEPTPGIGLSPAAFSTGAVDNPATPDVDESLPTPTPTAAPTSAPDGATRAPVDEAATTDDATAAAGATASIAWPLGIAALAALLLAAPWAVRARRRAARLGELERGASVVPAWHEVLATARDLGWVVNDTGTPRAIADSISRRIAGAGPDGTRGASAAGGTARERRAEPSAARAALDELRAAVERESYAERPATVSARDVRLITAAMRRSAGRGARILATVLPRSLFPEWMLAPA